MPTLADALIAKAKNDVNILQAGPPARTTRTEIKQMAMAMATMHPTSIKAVSLGAAYMEEYAAIIGHADHVFKLKSFVTVTMAAVGVQAIWAQVMWVWANTPDPQPPAAMDPNVELMIDTLIPNYVALIAQEKSPPAGP